MVAYAFYNTKGVWVEGKSQSRMVVKWLTVVASLMIGVGFIYRHWMRKSGRVKDVGAFGEKAYWNGYVHAALFLTFAVVFATEWAWVFLALSVVIGLGEIFLHYDLFLC
jgi:hypothetical protein